ncbi:Protein GAMETE EXPRESSED 2 [Linum grandiflorum]
MAFRTPFLSPIFVFVFILLASSASQLVNSSDELPKFSFSWIDENNQFVAGDVATIRITVLGEFGTDVSLGKSAFSPVLTVNDKAGDSSYISGIRFDTASNDTNSWRISFTPIMAGAFNVLIVDDRFKVLDSSLHYTVSPGRIYPSACIVTWMDLMSEFTAGSKAVIFIVPRDAFGNNVTSIGEDLTPHNFTVSVLYGNGSLASLPNITSISWNQFDSIFLEFLAEKAGTFILDVQGGNQTLNGCPLPFKVNPGPLDVQNCRAGWKVETNVWQIYSKMEIIIHQQDKYGNIVPGSYEFDADVIEKETHMLVPVADLHFEEVLPGIQLLSFGLYEPGSFLLTISDFKHSTNISAMPFEYTVFIGYCNGSASIVNGTGLNVSVAGETARFSLYLVDTFQYPSFVEIESIRVQIEKENDSYSVQPSIFPIVNAFAIGNGSTDTVRYDAISQLEISPAPSIDLSRMYARRRNVLASVYDVVYTPERSGTYEIFVFCGNILLNGGHSFKKEVKPGDVNLSLSGVVTYVSKVAKIIQNEVVVQLMDSFRNPVPLLQSRLKLESASVNSSGFSAGIFNDNNDGSYNCGYMLKTVGTYEFCVSFDGQRFSTCPIRVNAYGGEFFPRAHDDYVSVSEDESVAFDVLGNDYFAGNNASITQFSKPGRGSLLLSGHVFRYTPFKDYYGDDSFIYTMSDINGNLATAAVNISVLSIPPQFISFPSEVHATEDKISPQFGGFTGFKVRYSESAEDITVTLGAGSGTVLLSPMLMHFFQPISGQLSVEKREEGGANSLMLKGCVDVINLALQSVQYLGNENFSGNDTLLVSASNLIGKTKLNIPVLVVPTNDPPFINAPKYIILKKHGDKSLIFDKNRDDFEFSVGDPDLANYPGSESQFIFAFSVEVDIGFLETVLPAELRLTTELKLQSSHMWQPLQTYVTISKHFVVRASGVRFRGTVNDCNSVLQQLAYNGGEQVAVLTVKLNDMGHYGGSSDCVEKISVPMFAKATISLVQGKPMGFLASHSVGIAVILEFIIMSSLGAILLFFTCKCAVLLVHERNILKGWNPEITKAQNLEVQISNADPAEDTAGCNLCCSIPCLHSGQPSTTFRKRSRQEYELEAVRKDEGCTNQLSRVPSFLPLAIEKGKS